jgi:predicted CoA-substrate-specific enzyme activase
MHSLGVCIGASTISFVELTKQGRTIKIIRVDSITHEGNPRSVLSNLFTNSNFSRYSVVATGRKFKHLLNAHAISESEAIEKTISHLSLQGKYDVVASLGGESFIVYCLNGSGEINNVITGNKCAAGTGEFFLQQIGRMNLDIGNAVAAAKDASPHVVSGRCSVFCKSDCTHALNKGIPKNNVASGLCKMIADKAIELLSKQKSRRIIIVGGVSKNPAVLNFIREKYPDTYVPDEAPYFEAYGAALKGLESECALDTSNLFANSRSSYSTLEPFGKRNSHVTFKSLERDNARENDMCILGLDVGSTTTKAVIIRESDNAILASVYLRTNGSPVQASIECYDTLRRQINVPVKIIGLGTTGSGRHIAALHALTKGIVNEIIAHAAAAAYFDREVDTIFEIGGQDAKYTFLTNGIASDYAMNEACSAGTGSFLEEAAKESLNIHFTDIGDIAFTSQSPLNFNDQCAAFISSDIKNASHSGASKEDIVAGLVYSICMNYANRVKGNRPVGRKVFMQGGVCYNRAVPYAMSNLINKEIIVPPEPGLMGAFGAALEIKNRIQLGLLEPRDFQLDELIAREFSYGKKFICAGGKERCDRKCSVSIIIVNGKKYPFGGACSKYYNQRNKISSDPEKHNLVKLRQNLVFRKYSRVILSGAKNPPEQTHTLKTIGIPKTFLVNTLYPVYYHFFTRLGFRVVLSKTCDPEGADKLHSSFCYPVEIAHGMFKHLLRQETDYIFLPHVTEMDNNDGHKYKRLCVFVQGEPYYLKSAFEVASDLRADSPFSNSVWERPKLISPVINFSAGYQNVEKTFINIAKDLGCKSSDAREAFKFAADKYLEMKNEFREIGRKILSEVEKDKDRFAIVLFGRSYNAFAEEANLNIPHKFATKNITIIPHDFLPSEKLDSYENMYWFTGQQILKSARFVKNHPQLFGVFITNFSCGPDSFILSYFRRIMGTKPSLTLELDSHSADVGIETRIDAALDIIKNYIELEKTVSPRSQTAVGNDCKPLSLDVKNKTVTVVDSNGKVHGITSPDLEVLIPSMGRYSTEAFSAICRAMGIRSSPLPVPTVKTMKYGRGLTTCKECLPFILTTGQLIEYIENHSTNSPPLRGGSGKCFLFFMPHGYGPCRQGQYYISMKDIIENMKIRNVGVLSMDDEASFDDLGKGFFTLGWYAILTADIIHDIESVISALAVDKPLAKAILESEWKKIVHALESGSKEEIYSQLDLSAKQLSAIQLKQQLGEAKIVSLIGEIYVRREEFSRSELMNSLIENGFVVRTAPISEYLYYSNYLLKRGIVNGQTLKEKSGIFLKDFFQIKIENKIRRIFSKSGLCFSEPIEIEKTIEHGKRFMSEQLVGESILTVGLALREVHEGSCGIISIGPFNCMPSRMSEAILNKQMNSFPFLYVETDGNSFPQITQSRIEIFMMQAERVYSKMKCKKNKSPLLGGVPKAEWVPCQ